MQGGNAARESAFQVLSNLQGELSEKVGEALQIATSVRNDLLGDHPSSATIEGKSPLEFSGVAGNLVTTSRRTISSTYELITVINELRAEIPRQDSPKMADGPVRR